MVSAAYGLLCRHGYLGTTITAVAQEAGVAVPTIYYAFGTKARLLDEALGAAVVGFDHWHPPPPDPGIGELVRSHDWWATFEEAPTAADALDIFVTNGVETLERVAPLLAALHGAAGDPEAAAVVERAEQRRVAAYREAVRIVAVKPGGLRPGLTLSAATDTLVALFSADLYSSIRLGRGWSARRTVQLMRRLLERELLPSSAPSMRG